MKKIAIILGTAFIVTSAFVYKNYSKPGSQGVIVFKSGIHGTITPPEGAKKVWAIGEKDSVSAMPQTGNFMMDVKPGNWKLHIQAVPPYKDAVVENLHVKEGQYTDAGVIQLLQE